MKMKGNRASIGQFVFMMITTLFIVFLSIAGCERYTDTPINIGLVTTLTGPAASAGILTRNGAILAIEQFNNAGGVNGRRVEAIVRDDKGNPAEALRVDVELINAGVVAFLGHYLSSVSVAVVPLMNKHNIVMLSLGAATGQLYGLDDSFIRILVANNVRTPLAARVSYQRLGLRKVAVVCDLSNEAYSQSVIDLYRNEFERLGGEVVKTVKFYPAKGFDAPGIADKLLDSSAEGIFIITDGIHAALVAQHVRRLNASIPMIDSAWGSSDSDFISHGGPAVEGMLLVTENNESSTNPSYLAFKKAYRERFGREPTLHAQNAYDAASLLLKGLAKTMDPAMLKEELLKKGQFQGVDGTIFLDRYGEAKRPLYLLKVQNGRRRLVETLKIQ